jgi:UDP-N-acetylmuramate: L-alanyl-gamma-D-glutamyl-meso-diaminopimelate ligase
VHYRPRTAILNNLEFDHADIFADLAAIETQFHHLVRTVPSSGRWWSTALEEAWRACCARLLERGAQLRRARRSPASCARAASRMPSTCCAGSLVAAWSGPLGGVHNQLNALAAIAAAEHVGVAPDRGGAPRWPVSATCAAAWNCAARWRGVTVYDDFAHHPTAIRTTLDGLRRKVGPA